MRNWLPPIAVALGFATGYFIFRRFHLPGEVAHTIAPYVSIAALSGLDTVFGGIRAGIDGKFQQDVFISGFLLNTLLAAGLAWLGDWIGVDLFLAAVVALGTRIFLNLSLIRRYYLTKLALSRRKESPVASNT